MIGLEVVTGIIEIIVACGVLLAIWKFVDRFEDDTNGEKTKR